MKLNKTACLILVIGLAACGSSSISKNTPSIQTVSLWKPPAAGTLVASTKEKIREDKLNNLDFKVQVYSTDSSWKGFYHVVLAYGYGKEETTVEFPTWTKGTFVKPVLKKGNNAYEVQLGFDAGDSVFRPYYEIKMADKSIKMDKVRKYVLE